MTKPDNVRQAFWDSLTEQEKNWVCTHESLHEVIKRKYASKQEAWNAACDHVINIMTKEKS